MAIDLFGDADDDSTAQKAQKTEGGRIPRKPRHAQGGSASEFGGHNLRTTIAQPTKGDPAQVERPKSTFSPQRTPANTNGPATQGGQDNDEHEYDEDSNSEDEEDSGTGDSNDEILDVTPTTANKHNETPFSAPAPSVPPASQPFALTHIANGSRLGNAARVVAEHPGYSLAAELLWQKQTEGEAAKLRTFRLEVTQQNDLVAFVFIRPSSPFLQVIHSIATYAVRGGTSDLHNKDFGFVGDRTDLRIPAPVMLDEKLWKYVTKKVVLDIGPLEVFYAQLQNKRKWYTPTDRTGAANASVPRMLQLPAPFLVFCLERQRTPFELHQFIARYATREDSEVNIDDCQLLMDWCIVAAHAGTSPTSSMLETALQTAPGDDENFLRWLRLTDCTLDLNLQATGTHGTPGPPPAEQATAMPQHTSPVPPKFAPPTTAMDPTADVWRQMATNLSQSIVAAAAALNPSNTDHATESYEDGGKKYDEFQLAILMGFSHSHDVTGVPRTWARFQYTKNMDTHRDNIKRKMIEWATSEDHPMHVSIDRGLFFTTASIRDIISLKFNPGGTIAEPETAHLGLSILMCRARSAATTAAIRRYELAAERSKRSRTLAEAEHELTAYDTGMALPDDYNELLRCLGTYCALLHALFGKKCAFYRHCYQIWTTMNSDYVFDRRTNFSPLFCRQIVWAIIEEGRAYFSQRLSTDDFIVDHPEEVRFPRSSLARIDEYVRDGTPIVRSTFPPQWVPGAVVGVQSPLASNASAVPLPFVGQTAPAGTTPTVVSGITTGTTRTNTRPPVVIRPTNVHPQLKAAMEPYIAKVKGIYLTAMLNHVGSTIDDLPKLAPEVSGSNGICYNYVLGRCASDSCNHSDGHVNAHDVTDEFATDLITKLRPAITEFMQNGLPPNARRRRGNGWRRRQN